MKRLPNIRRVVFVAIAALLWSLLVAVLRASATDSWPIDLGANTSANVRTHSDGKISVGVGCSSATSDVNIYGPDAALLGQIPATAGSHKAICSGQAAVTPQGFTLVEESLNNGDFKIVAYDGEDEVWTYDVGQSPCYGSAAPADMNIDSAIGADGNYYLLLGYQCPQKELVKLNPATGAEMFRVPVNLPVALSNGIKAYANGIVLYQYPGTFRFFSYSGVENSSLAYTVPFDGGLEEYANNWAVGVDGSIFAAITRRLYYGGIECHDNRYADYTDRIVKRKLDQSVITYQAASFCMGIDRLQVTPDGGAMTFGYSALASDIQESAESVTFVKLSPANSQIITKPVTQPANAGALRGISDFGADVGGNIVLTRQYFTQNDWHTEFLLLDEDGNDRARFTTEMYGTNGNDEFLIPSGTNTLGLSNGAVYAEICNGWYSCAVYKVGFSELQIDYPRGVFLGMQSNPVSQRKLVVLGDSYAAVEGVPDFIPGTDDDSIETYNKCHRSQKSYAKLLDQDPSTNIKLEMFLACSGAKTNDMYVPQYASQTQPSQLFALDVTPDEDAVVVSISGNDADFEPTLVACTTEGEAACATARTASRNKINNVIPDKLSELFEDIGTKVPSTAEVLIIGYPQIFPLPAQKEGVCKWANPAGIGDRNITDTELTDMVDMSNLLNAKLHNAATAAGFTFVDMTTGFAGKQICTAGNVFNINMAEDLGTWNYHPDVTAQPIYRDAIKAALN